MEENLSRNQAPTSSKASSSFFIENILGNRGSGQESDSSAGRWISAVERVASGSDPNASAHDGSCFAVRSLYRDPPVQWYRSGTELNLAALETSESE